MSFDFGKECIDFIGCQSESIKSHKESVYKKEPELISNFLDEREKDEQPKKLSKLINIIEDCIKTGHINFISASMILLSRLTAPKDTKYQKKLTPPTVNNLLEYITTKFKNINCVKYIVIILRSLYEEYPYIKNQIIPIVLQYFTGEETNIIAYGMITHNNALKIISHIIDDILKGDIKFNDEQKNKFLSVIVDNIDETQDPRNLKLIFDFVPKLSLFIDKQILEKYSKNIFECLFGFFPINFNTNDTKNVKKDELVSEEELTKLLNNLISQEMFNEFLFEEIDFDEYKNSSDLLILFQSLINNYSYELLSKYYDKIIGYILSTLEDNNIDDTKEFLNIQCFMTYKLFLEKYYPYDNNIESTWNKLYDKIFSDDIKIMTIGKDMICPIITYDKQNKYIKKSIELFIKMISLYSFDLNKYMILKYANSIIFFILNKKNEKEYEDEYIKSLDILKENKKLLINIITDKKYYNNNTINNESSSLSNTNLFIIISDILTGIITKIKIIKIFEYEEIREIFDIIYNYYINEIDIDNESDKDLDHLCLLIVEINKNIEKEYILYNKIKNLFLSNNKKFNYLIKQIYNLTKDIKLKKSIIKDLIQNIESNKEVKDLFYGILSEEKEYNKKIEILADVNDNIEEIIISHINDESFNNFIYNIIDNLNIISLNKIIQHIIDALKSDNISLSSIKLLLYKLNNFIKILMRKQKEEKNFENNEELYTKIKLLYDIFNNKKILFNNLDYKSNILNCLKKVFKFCSIEFRSKIINEFIISKINKDDEKLFYDIKMESYISLLINYIFKKYDCLLKEKIIQNSFEDLLILKIFNEINSLEPINKKVFEKSLLFKIKDMPQKIRDKLLISLKKYYSSKKEENNLFLNLLMNIYNSLPLEEQNNNLDILLSLNIECINKAINPIQSIFNLRKLIINVKPKEIKKLSDLINIYPLCNNIINIIYDEKYNLNNQLIKIEGIKLIGILSGFIQEEEWEKNDKKVIIFNLKRYFLNDKKRNVRYTTGIVLNLLGCTKPKISFFN